MRRNVFLHFLNRDTREIFGLYESFGDDRHRSLIRRALNAAVALCEDRCIAPPGFVVEDHIAFDLAENQRAYLEDGVLQFPMRESSLAEFAEKKRIGYELMRDRYSGLFSDTRIGLLGQWSTGIIGRRSHITDNILTGWQGGPESGSKVWKPVKDILRPTEVDLVANVPVELYDRGIALTWSAIEPKMAPEAHAADTELRDALQHIYFQQYCAEFKLTVLRDIPHIQRNFLLPRDRAYSYTRLRAFLDAFDLGESVLDSPADLIVDLRRRPGFIAFMDAYACLAEISTTNTDLKFHAGRARSATKYDWSTIAARKARLFDLNPFEVLELDDVLREAADVLVTEHGLARRDEPVADLGPKSKPSTRRITPMPRSEADLVFFVALGEELDVLADQLDLQKNTGTPEASGAISGVPVEVICPHTMGRVEAAIAMTDYLAKRTSKPKLVMIVGIAGGFPETDSKEGHIVCVTKAVDLAIRKVVDEEEGASPNFRREDYRMSDALSRVIRAFDTRSWSNEACDLGWPDDRRPSIHYGLMASADEVISSNEWRARMLDADDKLLGIEMEAGGVCAAAERARVPYCMLRAISDQADPSKADNEWRKLGMQTIAHLLQRLPLEEVLRQA